MSHPSCGCQDMKNSEGSHCLPSANQVETNRTLAENAAKKLPSSAWSPWGPLQGFLSLATEICFGSISGGLRLT